jgi:anti-anti-sigma factor
MDVRTNSDLVPTARVEGDALILAAHGEIDLHNSSELRTVIFHLLTRNPVKRLVLNLSQVPYMDSSAVAVLVEAVRRMKPTGGKVCLTALQPRVQGLLEIARLLSIFTVAKDEAEALTKSA